jgi:methyl-accepting chemotaxis protein/methyl-accepting chemotaxis protein-1 (serine sensor receptor)
MRKPDGAAMSNTVQQWDFSSRARRDGRSLVPLAALVGVALVATAVLGLFGQHYGHKGYVEEARQVDALITALDDARQAQVHFKVQVQEWKNILLRGHDPAAFARYRARFEAEEAAVAALLRGLAADPPPSQLLTEHRAMGEAYRAALADVTPFDATAVDARVRGMDRAFNESLDALADSLRAGMTTVRAASAAANRARFEALRTASLWGLAVCVGLVGLFLMAVMRADRQRGG